MENQRQGHNENRIVQEDCSIKMTHQSALEELYQRRIKRLRFYCFYLWEATKVQASKMNVKLHFVHSHNLAACKVPKIGGTSLMHLLLSLNRSNFELLNLRKSRRTVHIMTHTLAENYNKAEENDRIFLVSRNPYSRLYSAYIDKIFLPGMKSYSYAVAQKNNKTSGKNTTFEDFLRDVTNDALSGRQLNRHWKPVYDTCEPCIIPYDVIAKQESYSEDIEYIVSKLNVTEEVRSLIVGSLHNHRTKNSINEITKEMFVRAIDTNGIFGHSFVEFCERLWESFKIQGYIRSTLRFPEEEFKDLSYSSVHEALGIYVHYATVSNMSYSECKQQRYDYLSTATNMFPMLQ